MVDDGPWLYYKLTNEPKGLGELKICLYVWMVGCHLPGRGGFTEYVLTELSRTTLAFLHLKTTRLCRPWRLIDRIVGGRCSKETYKVFTIYWHGSYLGHVTQTPQTNFRSPIRLRLHMKFGFDRPRGFGEEDLWKWWTTDGWQTQVS